MSISLNVLAGLSARIWLAGMQFIFTPICLRFLGADAYGLVGFYMTILATLMFLDQCISPVATRELARLRDKDESVLEMRNTLRTLELISFASALFIGLSVFASAPLIAKYWIHPASLQPEQTINALRLMGASIACQWPSFMYTGGFIGLLHQASLTRIRMLVSTLQWGGAALLLWLVSKDIEIFFMWQTLCFATLSLSLRHTLWKIMPKAEKPARFDKAKLLSVRHFAAGNLAIGLLSSLLTQTDKLLIAKYASMEQFSAYSLSFMLGSMMSILVAQPIGASLLPHFTRLFGEEGHEQLAHEYHRWTQIVSLISLPIAGTFIVFGKPLVDLWLGGNSPIAIPVMQLLPWVVLGTLLNVLITLPYILQISAGWTSLSVFKNIIAIAILLPALIYGIPKFGPIVGAGCWLALNGGYYLFEVPCMHRRLLPHEMKSWWWNDTLLPALYASPIFAGSYMLSSAGQSRIEVLAQAFITALIAGIVLMLLLPHPRALFKRLITR